MPYSDPLLQKQYQAEWYKARKLELMERQRARRAADPDFYRKRYLQEKRGDRKTLLKRRGHARLRRNYGEYWEAQVLLKRLVTLLKEKDEEKK